jgi:hypothetical protein
MIFFKKPLYVYNKYVRDQLPSLKIVYHFSFVKVKFYNNQIYRNIKFL